MLRYEPPPIKEWHWIVLILIVLVALGLGQAIKKHTGTAINNLPLAYNPDEIDPLASTIIRLNGISFLAEIAETAEKQARGLSGRAALGEREGMLFVFPEPNTPNFWMKKMLIPLDIIWLDENKKVVGIEENVSPDSYPQTFSPISPILYVLETPAGTVEKTGLKTGDLIHFSL